MSRKQPIPILLREFYRCKNNVQSMEARYEAAQFVNDKKQVARAYANLNLHRAQFCVAAKRVHDELPDNYSSIKYLVEGTSEDIIKHGRK